MNEESFEQLFEEKTLAQTTLQPGDRVEAVIAAISGEHIFLDVGGKSEGVLNAAELRDESGQLNAAVGDVIKVYFLALRGGEKIFATRLGSAHASARELEEAFEAGVPVQGTVSAEVKGGFSVMVAGQRCFCPFSQMDIRKVEQAENYLEKSFAFKIMEFGQQGKNVILSARAVLEEQRALEREALKQRLKEGMQVAGVVSSLRAFGAFIDLGGIDGLIPISELAWGQTDRVEDVLSLGQQVEVVIKQLDWDRDRISLSLRETMPNPWDTAAERYPLGSIHQGRVSRLAEFGAFITLEPGIDGLLHISKIGAGRKIHHPRELLEVGQEITVKIEALDTQQKRISLAPEDYVPKARKERREEAPFVAPPLKQEKASMGTLGDLFAQARKRKEQ